MPFHDERSRRGSVDHAMKAGPRTGSDRAPGKVSRTVQLARSASARRQRGPVIQLKPDDELLAKRGQFIQSRSMTIGNRIVEIHENYEPSTDAPKAQSDLIALLRRYDSNMAQDDKVELMKSVVTQINVLMHHDPKAAGVADLLRAVVEYANYLQRNKGMLAGVETKVGELAKGYEHDIKSAQGKKHLPQDLVLELRDKVSKVQDPKRIRGPILRLVDGVDALTDASAAAQRVHDNLRALPFVYTDNNNPGTGILEGRYEGDCSTLSYAMREVLTDVIGIPSAVQSIRKPVICIRRPILGRQQNDDRGLIAFDNHYWVTAAGKAYDPLFGAPLTKETYVEVTGSNKEEVATFIRKHAASKEEAEELLKRFGT